MRVRSQEASDRSAGWGEVMLRDDTVASGCRRHNGLAGDKNERRETY